MRTDIVFDDKLIERAKRLSGTKTKRGVVERALHIFIQLRERAKVYSLRGKLRWEGDLDEQRQPGLVGK